jgi:transcription termination factor Rho
MKLVLEARSRTLVVVSGPYSSPELASAIRRGQPSQQLIVLLAEPGAAPAQFATAEVVVVAESASPAEQVALVKATFERAAESDAILLVDSLSRIARMSNRLIEDPTEWVVSGIEPRRLEPLKQLLSAGTTVAIVELDDSRPSQVIHELFKPLASSELTWSG